MPCESCQNTSVEGQRIAEEILRDTSGDAYTPESVANLFGVSQEIAQGVLNCLVCRMMCDDIPYTESNLN